MTLSEKENRHIKMLERDNDALRRTISYMQDLRDNTMQTDTYSMREAMKHQADMIARLTAENEKLKQATV